MSKEDPRANFLGQLFESKAEKKPKRLRPRKALMSVETLAYKFAYRKSRQIQTTGDPLFHDYSIEFGQERQAKRKLYESEGQRLNHKEQDDWDRNVVSQMKLIRKRTHMPIVRGSDEEQAVFKAIWEFRKRHPEISNSLVRQQFWFDGQEYY